jgi:methylthioribulose-1-phosphate dehydratase
VTAPADYPALAYELSETCHRFGERGWCRATSGNFSARIDDANCLITQSGRQKSRLTIEDLMVCGLDGQAANAADRPSAETPLHTALYRLDASIGAVLHTHSICSTVLSRQEGDTVTIDGYEMQKALAGVTTHDTDISVRIFVNDQDMHALSGRLQSEWPSLQVPGFLIAGHGLYAWGRDLAEAERHVEGFEFLFECLWQEQLAGRR